MNIKKTRIALTGITFLALTAANGAVIGYYTFDDATSTGNVVDASSQGAFLDGSLSPGASTIIATGGFDGGGFTRLDNTTTGNDQYWVSGGAVGASQWAATPRIVDGQARTFAFWVRADSTQFDNGNSRIALFSYGSNDGADTGDRLELNFPLAGGTGVNLNDLRVEVNGNGSGGGDVSSFATNLADGGWHHLALTVPQGGTLGQIELYVDGSSIGAVGNGSNPSITTTSSELRIGQSILGSGQDRGFTGDIDEFRMYNSVLSPGEIATLATVPEPSTYALIGGLLTLGLVMVRRRLR